MKTQLRDQLYAEFTTLSIQAGLLMAHAQRTLDGANGAMAMLRRGDSIGDIGTVCALDLTCASGRVVDRLGRISSLLTLGYDEETGVAQMVHT